MSDACGGFDLAAPQPDVGQRAIVEVLQLAHGAALRRRHSKPVVGPAPAASATIRSHHPRCGCATKASADMVKADRMIGFMASMTMRRLFGPAGERTRCCGERAKSGDAGRRIPVEDEKAEP